MTGLPKFLLDLDPNIYKSNNFLVLDFETTNLDKGSALNPDNELIMAVWYTPSGGWKHTINDEYNMYDLLADIDKVDYIICHNTKFELQWLDRCGLDISTVLVYDTMIGDYVLGGNRQFRVSLEACAKRHGLGTKLSWVSKYLKNGTCLSLLPTSSVLRYCYIDVSLTFELFIKQRKIIIARGLLPIAFTRNIFTPVLADIEANGMHADKDAIIKEYKAVLKEYTDVALKIDDFTGGINPNSPVQKAEFFYNTMKFNLPLNDNNKPILGKPNKHWPEGAPSTGKDAIAALVARNSKQQECLDLFKLQGMLNAKLSKTLKPLYACVTETNDQLLYAKFNQCVTKTHRLSSTGRSYGVQFQNFPRAYKHLFSSRYEDWLIGEIDGSQLEFRVAGFLGQDVQIIEDIKTGYDVHSFTASVIKHEDFDWIVANKKTDKVAEELRNSSKADTFKPLYGGTKGTPEQEEYYRAFNEKYSGIVGMQDSWVDTALKTKKLVLGTGLITYWPYIKMTKYGFIEGHTKVRNLPVQYLATAEIIPIAVTYLWHYMRQSKMKSYMINTVHDSAISEVHPEEKDLYSSMGNKAFTSDVYNYLAKVYNIDFNVELEAEVKYSKNWGEV